MYLWRLSLFVAHSLACSQLPAAGLYLMRVLILVVWMSYSLFTASLICRLLARLSTMNTWAGVQVSDPSLSGNGSGQVQSSSKGF